MATDIMWNFNWQTEFLLLNIMAVSDHSLRLIWNRTRFFWFQLVLRGAHDGATVVPLLSC